MTTNLPIALCGLSARDERMVQVVLAHTKGSAARFSSQIVDSTSASQIAITIVDEQSPFGMEQLQRLHGRHPNVVPIFICDDIKARPGKFRLSRRSLLVDLLRVFDQAAGIAGSLMHLTPAPPASGSGQQKVTPQAPSQTRGAAAIEGNSGTDKPPPLTALIVDDSAVVRTQLQALLMRVGIRCVLAGDAEQALALSVRHHYDIILLDIVMPGKDGYQLCRELMHNPYTRSTPVLMLTSRSSPFDRARGALAGCASYLVKPVEPKLLYGTVDKELMRTFHHDREQLLRRGYRQMAESMPMSARLASQQT